MSRAWIWTAIVIMLVAVGSYAAYLELRPRPLPAQLLYGNGHIEATEVRISSEVAGRTIDSALAEGKPVSAGDVLVRLDDADFRLRLEQTDAEIDAAKSEAKRVASELATWRHHLKTAQDDLARNRELKDRGTISSQQLEQVENAFEEARGRVGALQAQVDEVNNRIVAAERARDLLKSQLAKTTITAPSAGTILTKAVEIGEVVKPGQVIAVLADLSNIELKIYVPESEIGKVALRAPARVKIDAFQDRYFEASVSKVDQQAQFTPRDIHMPQERVRMVFGVTLRLANPDGILKPGMPADAWILWKRGSNWPDRLFVPQ